MSVQHRFEELIRALKRVNLTLEDPYELIKKGNPTPCLALMRKLLYKTSPFVLKYMVIRGIPAKVTDQKMLAGVYDLMRENARYSPPISLLQFLSMVGCLQCLPVILDF